MLFPLAYPRHGASRTPTRPHSSGTGAAPASFYLSASNLAHHQALLHSSLPTARLAPAPASHHTTASCPSLIPTSSSSRASHPPSSHSSSPTSSSLPFSYHSLTELLTVAYHRHGTCRTTLTGHPRRTGEADKPGPNIPDSTWRFLEYTEATWSQLSAHAKNVTQSILSSWGRTPPSRPAFPPPGTAVAAAPPLANTPVTLQTSDYFTAVACNISSLLLHRASLPLLGASVAALTETKLNLSGQKHAHYLLASHGYKIIFGKPQPPVRRPNKKLPSSTFSARPGGVALMTPKHLSLQLQAIKTSHPPLTSLRQKLWNSGRWLHGTVGTGRKGEALHIFVVYGYTAAAHEAAAFQHNEDLLTAVFEVAAGLGSRPAPHYGRPQYPPRCQPHSPRSPR